MDPRVQPERSSLRVGQARLSRPWGASDTVMTGEMTLTGLVLPIGGVKEKVLAARRAEMSRVVLPAGNTQDLRELPENVRAETTFVFAERVEEVFAAAIPALATRLAITVAA